MTNDRLARLAPVLWIGFLTLLITGPWLPPGYIFGTDFAGPRHYAFPQYLASYAPLQIVLAIVAAAVPSDAVGKLLIVAILAGAGFSAYYAVPATKFGPRAVAALVYMINPFVYDRLSYGQLTVLAGYAALPWVALSVRGLLIHPSSRAALVAAAAVTVAVAVDAHMVFIAGLLIFALLVAYLVFERRALTQVAQLTGYLGLFGAASLIANAYWVLPSLLGNGPQAHTLARISEGDLAAFSTAADPRFGLIPNVLGLYGFWAERTGRFVSMKDFAPLWPLALAVLVALTAIGAIVGWRRAVRDVNGAATRAWVVGLLGAAAIAIVLEIGISEPHVAPVVTWLDRQFPLYRAMRDAGKWASLVVLAYSQLSALAVVGILRIVRTSTWSASRQDSAVAAFTAAVFALPIYYGNGVLYGLHGQVHPSSYPAGWYSADRALSRDPNPGRAVFLPWHGYLALSFVRNTDQVVANPGPLFFSVPVIASEDLEVPGIRPPTDDPDQAMISRLVRAGTQADWAAQLTRGGFKYVLLAREADWTSYSYIDTQPGFVLVGDYTSILLYRNIRWG